MAYKQQPSKYPTGPSGLRPGQDVRTAKSAASFPSVGVSLPSYSPKSGQPKYPAPTIGTKKRPKSKTVSRKKLVKRGLITLLIIGVLTGGWVGGKFLYNAHKLFGGSLLGVLHTTKLKGEDVGRVNILLAGNSADDVGHQGGQLTDSIMLLSIDTTQHKAFMMSIPRDLWVDIPDDGHQKINGAYVVGENNDFRENNYPAGGMGQLEQVVADNFGISINYYALVNYNAFKQAVDAVGGIDYTVKSSDKRGLYDPNIDYTTNGPLVKLSNGPHHLSGQQALNLARARGDSYRAYGFAQADFDRTQHQREMLVALKAKAVSAGVIANPARLSSLADAIGGNVKTDLDLSEVRRLYDLTKDVGGGAITSVSLNDIHGVNLLANYQAPNGASALIPAAGLDDFSDIQTALRRLMSHNAIVQEDAKVVVLNATDTSGLAGRIRTTLKSKNVNVTDIGDAQANQVTTTIIDNSKGAKPETKKLLTSLYGTHFTTTNPYAQIYDADYIVLVGSDQVNKQGQN